MTRSSLLCSMRAACSVGLLVMLLMLMVSVWARNRQANPDDPTHGASPIYNWWDGLVV